MVWVGCFGGSVARLELRVEICVGAEVAVGIGPSEVIRTLLPSWPVGGASPTTDEHQHML